jgi:hypothetical protein
MATLPILANQKPMNNPITGPIINAHLMYHIQPSTADPSLWYMLVIDN